MAEWAMKRFWSEASIADAESGFAVRLDGRPVRTPAGAMLAVPTEALALALASEWDAQDGDIDPQTMPFTRMANSAIDKVAPKRPAVIGMLAEYGGTDLLCYRADVPAALVERQNAAWDPLLDWAEATFRVRLAVTSGVMPIAQPEGAVERLALPMEDMTEFELAGFHDLVALSGSLVLALATLERRIDPETAWSLSRLDEEWQADEWGHDEEADENAALKARAFMDAAEFVDLARRRDA
ncbi:chaperone required for assembly of F1-ATPase [Palleronia aestuarii]|uniref:Chaperone required for assembly of F1-ATPase n=1 Tax=Palleronia aestuarii TaxID=568105 RepID=A0A2W7NGM0_9RHOB|nr:ATP12 family protein [Palleronia aestuarii]PZX12276.1 chaperone required for assembly of F1-ATPase [Palleronia aestuarii]